jgi:predicted transposase YbfD/YdcC
MASDLVWEVTMEMTGAIGEGVVFLEYVRDVADPRQAGKVEYPLDAILLLCLLAVLAGAETFTDIARFGTKKLELLRRFRPFRGGTPAHDHLGDIFATPDAEKFQRCFVAWVAARTGAAAEVIAIVTIDAMGCQRDIARTIIDKQADYVLALKGNQGSLRDDVDVFVAEPKAKDFHDTTISRHQTVDGDHGRIETRTTAVIHDVAWLRQCHDWPGLKGIVMVESLREKDSLRLRRKVAACDDDFLESIIAA